MSLKVQVVPVTPYQQNCSIIQCEATGLAAIVDPGGDVERIEAAISKMDAKVEKILLTHGHLDHCAAADVLRQKLTVPMEGPEQGDSFWIDKLPEWCEMAGFPRAEPFTPDRWLEDGDTVTVGTQTLEVIHCPGHTPGHVCFHASEQQLVFVGDVLFDGSIGRTDLPGGDGPTADRANRGASQQPARRNVGPKRQVLRWSSWSVRWTMTPFASCRPSTRRATRCRTRSWTGSDARTRC